MSSINIKNVRRFGILTALVAFASLFFTWASATSLFISVSLLGLDYLSEGSMAAVLMFGSAFLIFVIFIRKYKESKVETFLRVIFPIFLAILSVPEIAFLISNVQSSQEDLIFAQVGMGMYVALLAAFMMFILGAISYIAISREKEAKKANVEVIQPAPLTENKCYCRDCGSVIGKDDVFCMKCGAEQILRENEVEVEIRKNIQ